MEFWSWPPRYDNSYLPDTAQPYWFPTRETMNADERDHAILERIQQVMRYAWGPAPFYRRKWAEAGISWESVRPLDDFERVPAITKPELRVAQAEHAGLRTSDGSLRVEMLDTIKELVREESAAGPRGTRLAKDAA